MVHRNISRAPKHLYSVQKCFDTAKYILEVPQKHLYECANIYLPAQIFLGLHTNILACAEIF